MVKLPIIKLSAPLAAALLVTTVLTPGVAAAQDELIRFATVPLGAEITGLYVTPGGDLFFNA
jgi:uncharacterized protein